MDILPKGDPSFTFNQEDFLKESFTVDDFMKDHRSNASLEQLRQDLSSYLRTLRLAMIDLINEDYSDFINLSANLVDLDSSINNLIHPLDAIRKEIERVEIEFNGIIEKIESNFNQLKTVRKEKEQVELVINVSRILNIIDLLCEKIDTFPDDQIPNHLIERVIIQMNEVSINLTKVSLNSCYVSSTLRPFCDSLINRVNQVGERAFTSSITSHNLERLDKLFQIYSLTGQLGRLEKLLINYVRPHFIDIATENRLEQLGTQSFYQHILDTFESSLKIFVQLKQSSAEWFLHKIWKELVNILTLQAPSLFSSGNPNQFHVNYTNTLKFFENFQSLNDPDLKLSKAYSKSLLMRKFNPSVYFRIRFQEIASKFESSLNSSYIYYPQAEKKFKINSLITLFDLITACWDSSKIYLPCLFPQFLKLTLQLISRYAVWLEKLDHKQLQIEKIAASEISRLKCTLLSLIVSSTEQSMVELGSFFETKIVPLKPEDCYKEQIKESLDDSIKLVLEKGLPNIVKLTKECLVIKSFSNT